MKSLQLCSGIIVAIALCRIAGGAAPVSAADQALARYFAGETAALEAECLATTNSAQNWKGNRAQFLRELQEMLGLYPLPAKSDLKATTTGIVEHEKIVVEKVHFQSLPGLYVTGNLYRPKEQQGPAPAILYLSGHGPVVKNGVSYGNKVAYQHHGAWFARNGYVCLIIDTIQLGEIEGLHHGTYRERMWWWNSRGYTPAGVEAWNSIRSLDYLSTRSEVDTNRFGVTGRSGGGAYSWWLGALDERIKVAAPVAGITDLRNHVVDGTVEGHCDCMFTVNTYRWDYAQVAALVAPRPLMIANTDSDTIFPLDGVVRLHAKTKKIYEAYNAKTNLALVITDGPHKDTQALQVPVFRWFNRYLKKDEPLIEMAAVKFFEPEQLKVFTRLPEDAINKRIQETFVPMAKVSSPPSQAAWENQKKEWLSALKSRSFRGWRNPPSLDVRTQASAEHGGVRLSAFDFTSQSNVQLRLYILAPIEPKENRAIVLNILGSDESAAGPEPSGVTSFRWSRWAAMIHSEFPGPFSEEGAGLTNTITANGEFARVKQWMLRNDMALAFVAPRGVGLTQWNSAERAQTQIRRRFMLLGQTLDAMRVWDIRRAIRAIRNIPEWNRGALSIHAEGNLAADVIYAALFENSVSGVELWNLPRSHQEGPDFLNVLQVLDIPQAVAMVSEKANVRLHGAKPNDWLYVTSLANNPGWKGKFALAQSN